MKRRVIIADIRSMTVDGKAVGHYFSVAANYLDIFQKSCDVMVAGGPVFEQKFSDLIRLPYDTDEKLSVTENKKRVFCNIRQLFTECANDIIVLQCSAVATAYLGIFLYKPSTCKVFLIQYNTLGIDSFLKKTLFCLAKNKIDGIVCPNDAIGSAYGLPYCVVPDYIYTGEGLCADGSFESKKNDFGMFGLIVPDKGIIEAARFFAGSEYSVKIAGYPQDEQVKKELLDICRKGENIELNLGYLSEEEYISGIKNSRYCILNYSGAYSEHSSGVVFDILFNGVPVIGKKCRSLEFIEKNNIGLIYDDISDVRFETIMNPQVYETYLRNIEKYFVEQRKNADTLVSFVLK